MENLFLIFVVFFAFFVQTIVGFGAVLIGLSLGMFVVPMKKLIITLVILTLFQNTVVLLRNFRHLPLHVLLWEILPITLVTLPFGYLGFVFTDGHMLKLLFALLVIGLSLPEVFPSFFRRAARDIETPGVGLTTRWFFLGLGGFFQGLLGTGGPAVVYYVSRRIDGKHAFRATMSAIWVSLNLILVSSYLYQGRIAEEQILLATKLLIPVVFGIVCGEVIAHRVAEHSFRTAVYVLLLITGVVMALPGR